MHRTLRALRVATSQRMASTLRPLSQRLAAIREQLKLLADYLDPLR